MELKTSRQGTKKSDEKNGSLDGVRQVLDREIVRPQGGVQRTGTTRVDPPSRPEYHPLAERALEKVNRARLEKESLRRSDILESKDPQPEVEPPKLQTPIALAARKVNRQINPNRGKVERIEINLSQGVLPFEDAVLPHSAPQEDALSTGLTAAPLAARVMAGTIDALFVFGCFLLFLGIVFFVPDFSFPTKSSLLGLAFVLVLLSVSYSFLFIMTGAQTLGMEYESLKVVSFDGRTPSLKGIGLRVFGSFTSLGCFMLGFIWAFFDPDRLTWHDRISKTLIVQRRECPSKQTESVQLK
ncbi:MAG TPA: RDD family protein [Terriglobia bacterium]|nr:RDD family protein [Terriglobia bacterium]